MSNYLRALISSPASYVVVVSFVALVTYNVVTYSTTDSDVEPVDPVEPLSLQPTPAPAEPPCAFLKCTEFDEEGRAIVMLGELPLHIPKNVVQAGRPTLAKMRDLQFGICWHNQMLFGWCSGVENVVSIRLSRIDEPIEYPLSDALEHLSQQTNDFGEPIESEFHGVYEHPRSENGKIRKYSLKELDNSGRYPVATCDHFAQYYGCKVNFVQHPQIRAEYRFHVAHLTDWPTIHSSVRDLLESFVVTQPG